MAGAAGEGLASELRDVEHDMRQRDQKDAERAAAPLRVAEDAYRLDTTAMDADAAFDVALAVVKARI